MRYTTDSKGRLKEVSFGALISCDGRSCTEYVGAVPEGYDDLVDWFAQEADKLYRWYVVEGQLTLDEEAVDPVMPEPCRPLSMTKVWENDDHTSGIGTATLEIDLSAFQMVAVEYRFNTANDYRKMAFGAVGNIVTLDVISTSFYLGTRQCVISTDGVTVGEAAYSGTGSSVNPDNYMIPTRIFGIKGIAGLTGNVGNHAICGLFLCGGAVCG